MSFQPKSEYKSEDTFRHRIEALNFHCRIRKTGSVSAREEMESSLRTLECLLNGLQSKEEQKLLAWIEDSPNEKIKASRLKGYNKFKDFRTTKPGEWAAQIRNKHRMTQAEWAGVLGVPRTYITAIEGRYQPFTAAWYNLLLMVEEHGIKTLKREKLKLISTETPDDYYR